MCVNTASSHRAAYCVESDRSRGWYSRSIVLVSAATLDNCGGARV
jgi:hypothetical protein